MKTQDEQFAESLHLVAHAWRNELDRRLRPLGFSHSRWLLLLHLSRHDGCTHCELAQHMGIEAATLVKQVDHMEQEGLLKRCGSETDRRVKHLQLSASGKKAVERIRSAAAQLRLEILAGTSKEHIGIAIGVMQNIRDQLDKLP
ncbi:MAG: MarR family transcriptional regulator [Sideroxyarcus sp.]|nr:MarR family transcriptional regulator [Sideroxyarcus sp.]